MKLIIIAGTIVVLCGCSKPESVFDRAIRTKDFPVFYPGTDGKVCAGNLYEMKPNITTATITCESFERNVK